MNYDDKIRVKLLKNRTISESGCWLWTGSTNNSGYGYLGYLSKSMEIHRLSLKLFKPGEYNEHLNVNHKCDSRKCFNPDHLYSGTQSQNIIEAVKKGNWQHGPCVDGFCKKGHKLTLENSYIHPNTGRKSCRICNKNRAAVRRLLK
jgi:hypothetical protein